MSDAEPARKDEADAPAGPRNPVVTWLVFAVLVTLLYVTSIGPVYWLVAKGYVPDDAYLVYVPLDYLPDAITHHIDRYLNLWTS